MHRTPNNAQNTQQKLGFAFSYLERYNYPPKGWVVKINQHAKCRGIYLALFTDPEGDSGFSINQISWIKRKKGTFCKLSLCRNFFYTFVKCILRFCCKFSVKIIFYLPVNTDKQKLVTFFIFVCTTAIFIAQISSSENVSRWDAIWAPVAKQWIGKDIPSSAAQFCLDFECAHRPNCMALRSTSFSWMFWKIVGVNLVGILRTVRFLVFHYYSITWSKL